VLLHFGWDWATKGGELFLDAVAELVGTGLDVIALTVGAGEEARRSIERRGLAGHVSIAPPRDDVRTYYAAADVFVSASVGEGLPLAVMEAVATGTAVVASDIPGHRALDPGTGAYRVVARRADAMAAAIAELLERPAGEAAGEARLGRAWIEANLSLERWGDALFEVYDEVLSYRLR
jgi:glycosyltransferase involved in cell wall biosynthesis